MINRFTVVCLLAAISASCTDGWPVKRTGPNLVAFLSGLPIPADARVLKLSDAFAERDGTIHNQGSLEATVELDSAAFDAALKQANELDYRKIESYEGPQRIPAIEATQSGVYRLSGDVSRNFALTVVDSEKRTVSVQLVRITGMP